MFVAGYVTYVDTRGFAPLDTSYPSQILIEAILTTYYRLHTCRPIRTTGMKNRCCEYAEDYGQYESVHYEPIDSHIGPFAFVQGTQSADCVLKRLKAVYSCEWDSHLTATGRHLPYGITQCYLPPDTSERAPP